VSFTADAHPDILRYGLCTHTHTRAPHTTRARARAPYTYTCTRLPGGGSVLLGPPHHARTVCARRCTGPLDRRLSRSLALSLSFSFSFSFSPAAAPGTAYPRKVIRARSVVTRPDSSAPTTVKFPCPALTHRLARFARHTTGYVSYFHRDPG